MYIYSLFNDSSSVQTIHLYSYPVYLNIYGNLYYKSKITIVQSFSFFECSRTFDFSIILFINVLSTLPRASTTLSSVYFFVVFVMNSSLRVYLYRILLNMTHYYPYSIVILYQYHLFSSIIINTIQCFKQGQDPSQYEYSLLSLSLINNCLDDIFYIYNIYILFLNH